MSAGVGMTRAYDVIGRRGRPAGARAAVPWLLTVAGIATQIAYPLVDGDVLRRVTIASVVLFFAAGVTHAAAHRGLGFAVGLVAISAGGGFAVEAVGVRTGIPFGDYAYADTLGPQVLGVPVAVPLAWTMMAYPVLLAARRITRRLVALVGGFGLAAWDVFLDPQMVDDGHWTWAHPSPSLPGIDGVPLTNHLGWLLVSVLMIGALDLALPRDRGSEAVPAVLLVWTLVGSVLGNVFWFGETSVAITGGVAMGLFVLPYLWSLWQSRP